MSTPTGIVFTADGWEDVWNYVRRQDNRFTLSIPELLGELTALATDPPEQRTADFPFVLSAGERRSFTANTIFRDPQWRRRDPEGALRISAADASRLGLASGQPACVTTVRGSATALVEISDMMQPGHISLPNGYGLSDAGHDAVGVAPDELTGIDRRDPIAGTPWHKNVPAHVEAL